MSTPLGRPRRLVKSITTGLATTVVATTAVVALPQAAHAVPYYCGVAGQGRTTNVGSWTGATWTKATPGCLDFNMVWVQKTGNYGANYLNSSGNWAVGSGNYNKSAGWNGLAVMISNISTGTKMHILSYTDGQVAINR